MRLGCNIDVVFTDCVSEDLTDTLFTMLLK